MLKGRKIQKKKNKTKEEDVRRKKNFEGRKIRKNQKKKRVKEIQIKKDTKFSIKVRYV